jgi:hypothetical protein
LTTLRPVKREGKKNQNTHIVLIEKNNDRNGCVVARVKKGESLCAFESIRNEKKNKTVITKHNIEYISQDSEYTDQEKRYILV